MLLMVFTFVASWECLLKFALYVLLIFIAGLKISAALHFY